MDTLETIIERVNQDNALMRMALDKAVDGILITTPALNDNPIVYASMGFYKLTGYNPEDVLGHNCRFLQGQDTDPAVITLMSRAIQDGQSFKGTLTNYRKDGSPFLNQLRIEPVFNINNDIQYYIGAQIDTESFRR